MLLFDLAWFIELQRTGEGFSTSCERVCLRRWFGGRAADGGPLELSIGSCLLCAHSTALPTFIPEWYHQYLLLIGYSYMQS